LRGPLLTVAIQLSTLFFLNAKKAMDAKVRKEVNKYSFANLCDSLCSLRLKKGLKEKIGSSQKEDTIQTGRLE
jgi:hypothetical protein